MRTRYTILRDTGAGWVRYFISDYLRVLNMEEVPNDQLVEFSPSKDFVNCQRGWYKIGERVDIPALSGIN